MQLGSIRSKRREEIDEIEKTFGPLDQLVPYYVTPDAQNVNPADLEDDDTGLVARDNIFKLLDTFFAGPARFSHAFVLSDAGMGKSSLLVMLKLFFLTRFIQPAFQVKLLKIGPDTIELVRALQHPTRTVLLLDALDEDPEAWKHFYTRLQMLLHETKGFRKVVITCRTQFFPQEYEEDGKIPGRVVLSGFHCSKLFLSPFSLPQVHAYLIKRFRDEAVRKQAIQIVGKMQSLKFRPMLLSYIDFLLDGKHQINYSYALYESLVDEWLNRELRKGIIDDKKTLYKVCIVIADHMYAAKARDLDPIDLQRLYLPIEGVRQIEAMSVEGRSLLHRTSSGDYKFAHLSILEYFVATSLSKEPKPGKNSDQVITFIGDILRHRKLRQCRGLDLHGVAVSGASMHGADFADCILVDSDLSGAQLDSASFFSADLTNSNLSMINAVNGNFSRAKVAKTSFSNARLAGASFVGVDFSGCDLGNADFTQAQLEGAKFSKAKLHGARFRRVKSDSLQFDEATMNDCDLSHSVLPNGSFSGANMSNACLEDAVMTKTSFRNANLLNVKMSRFNGTNCDFRNAVLDGVGASGAILKSASAEGIHAQGSVFDGGNAAGADFSRADFDHASFRSCNLEAVNFRSASLRSAMCQHAMLVRAKMTEIEAAGADFSKSTLTSADLTRARLSNGIFQEADFSRAKMEGGDLTNADLTKAILVNTVFRASKLSGIQFHSSDIRGTSFEMSNLQKAVFRQCRLTEVDFSAADLRGATFLDSSFAGCKWNGAQYDSRTQWPSGFDPRQSGAIGPGAKLHSKSFGKIDLTNADLQDAVLSGCDFKESSLAGSNLQGADLSFCDFFKVSFAKANLAGANLSKSDLRCANFSDAELSNAILEGAKYDENTQFPPEIKLAAHRLRLLFATSKRG